MTVAIRLLGSTAASADHTFDGLAFLLGEATEKPGHVSLALAKRGVDDLPARFGSRLARASRIVSTVARPSGGSHSGMTLSIASRSAQAKQCNIRAYCP